MKKYFALFLVLLVSQVAFAQNGDVNGDGAVTSADVTCLYNYLLNGNESYLATSDVDGDGVITSADVTVIYDILLYDLPVVTEYTVNGVSFKMVQVNGGTFTMGATAEQGSFESDDNEYPTHQVTLSTFSIGQTEVTQELWLAVMGSNPSHFKGDLQRPVERISWNVCQTFITKLNQMTGKNFRLPTEAEREYAARGGSKSQGYKYAGSNNVSDVAWCNDAFGGTHPVATKAPNELGIYDMSGNVRECCHDWYDSYSSDAQTNPTGPVSGIYRVHRGGSWYHSVRTCRLSCREVDLPGHYDSTLGLRLAL